MLFRGERETSCGISRAMGSDERWSIWLCGGRFKRKNLPILIQAFSEFIAAARPKFATGLLAILNIRYFENGMRRFCG